MAWEMKIPTGVCMAVNKIFMMMARKSMRILMKMIIMMKRMRKKKRMNKMKMASIVAQKR
jgi:hypothetical protein